MVADIIHKDYLLNQTSVFIRKDDAISSKPSC